MHTTIPIYACMYLYKHNYIQLPAALCIKRSRVINLYGIYASVYSANV